MDKDIVSPLLMWGPKHRLTDSLAVFVTGIFSSKRWDLVKEKGKKKKYCFSSEIPESLSCFSAKFKILVSFPSVDSHIEASPTFSFYIFL